MKKLITQILKFGVVGGLAFVIDYGIMIFLTEVCGIHYLVSSGFSFSISVIFNYVLSIFWVFDVDKEKGKATNFIAFLILSLIGLGLNQFLMFIFVGKWAIHYMISKIIVTAIVMVYNFITRKIFLEKKQ